MSQALEQQLAETQHELEVLRAEHNEFVYVVSHDLAAPLRQIEGFANIILSKNTDNFDDKTRHYFDLIIKGSEKGKTILDALLGYSRLTTKSAPYASVDCSTIVENVNSQLSSKIESSGAEIVYGDMPIVEGDSDQIYQLFYHLIHNALHYHFPGGQPIISIQAINKEEQWQFCIKDNGMGVLDNLTDKIFTVLRRGVTDKEYSGIGMGLAIAKIVVQRHGGSIWMKANKQEGCSFFVTLPKCKLRE